MSLKFKAQPLFFFNNVISVFFLYTTQPCDFQERKNIKWLKVVLMTFGKRESLKVVQLKFCKNLPKFVGSTMVNVFVFLKLHV